MAMSEVNAVVRIGKAEYAQVLDEILYAQWVAAFLTEFSSMNSDSDLKGDAKNGLTFILSQQEKRIQKAFNMLETSVDHKNSFSQQEK